MERPAPRCARPVRNFPLLSPSPQLQPCLSAPPPAHAALPAPPARPGATWCPLRGAAPSPARAAGVPWRDCTSLLRWRGAASPPGQRRQHRQRRQRRPSHRRRSRRHRFPAASHSWTRRGRELPSPAARGTSPPCPALPSPPLRLLPTPRAGGLPPSALWRGRLGKGEGTAARRLQSLRHGERRSYLLTSPAAPFQGSARQDPAPSQTWLALFPNGYEKS